MSVCVFVGEQTVEHKTTKFAEAEDPENVYLEAIRFLKF